MSRYLKEVSATAYRFKKYFIVPGTYSVFIPASVKQVKTIAFGGGGNSCTTTITNCLSQLQQCCCCCYVRGHFSGAGGGFTEKTWFGVGGQYACIVVGSSEGTSSICFCGFGSISATGGTGSGTSTRTTTGGSGSGGEVNRCGSPGYCRCTSGFCRYDAVYYNCAASNQTEHNKMMCSLLYQELRGVHLSGGTPGNSLCNRAALSDDTTNVYSTCCGCVSYGVAGNGGDRPNNYAYPASFACNGVTQHTVQRCTYTTVPGYCWGFPAWYCQSAFALGIQNCIDPFYTFDWDPIANCCCTCLRSTCTSPGTFSTTGSGSCFLNNFGGYNYCCAYCFVERNNESCTHTFLGAPGFGCAPGTTGGGGAGIWNGDETRCLSDYSRSGGVGLVVVHY